MMGHELAEGRGTLNTGYLMRLVVVAALGGLLFGYDTAVISGGIGPLQEHFGLTAAGKGWAASCALAGCVLGALLAGPCNDLMGRRRTLILAAVLFLVSAIGTALPRTFETFVTFRVIGGVGVGIASMTSPLYIAEVSPARLRGRMVSLNQFAIIFGMVVVYFVNYAIALQGDEAWNTATGWRWMFGSESVPAIALLLLLLTVPPTPRFLASRGDRDRARDILTRINGPERAEAELAEIEATLARETASWGELLRPGVRFALLVGIVLAILQQITGINVILYYAPEIFKDFGSETTAALLQTIFVGATNLLFTVVAIFTVDRLGRKPLLVVGAAGMALALFAFGTGAWLQAVGVWVLACILAYIAFFALSVGPVVWVVLSEIFPTKIRGRAMAVATLALWGANFVVSQTFPMMNENEWLQERLHGAFPFWVYGFFCFVTIVFVLVFVPETKGKSLEEIERALLKTGEPMEITS